MLAAMGLLTAACGKLLPAVELDGSTSGSTTVGATTTADTPPTTTGVDDTGTTDDATTVGSSSTGPTEPECGNGIVEVGELCFEVQDFDPPAAGFCAFALGDVVEESEYPDLILVPCGSRELRIFPGGAGGLEQVPFERTLTMGLEDRSIDRVVLGDWVGDARLDVLVPDTATQLVIYPDVASASVPAPTIYNTNYAYRSVATGEVDGTLGVDIAAIRNSTGEVDAFWGTGNPTPLSPLPTVGSGFSTHEPLLSDLDEDGYADLLLSTGASMPSITIYANDGGAFNDAMPQLLDVDSFLQDVTAGQLDGRPGLEIMASHYDVMGLTDTVTIFSPTGGITYGEGQPVFVGPGNPLLLAVADFDRDGLDDLVSSQSLDGGNSLVLSRNMGGLVFESPSAMVYPLDEPPAVDAVRFLDVADFNGDGVLDAVAVTTTSRVVVFLSNP